MCILCRVKHGDLDVNSCNIVCEQMTDVKRSLGIGYFASEYFANTYEDLTWAQFLAHCSTDDSSKAMSFAEKQVIEEKVCAVHCTAIITVIERICYIVATILTCDT